MRRVWSVIGVWVFLGTLFFLPRDTSFVIKKALAVDIPYKYFDEFSVIPPPIGTGRTIERKNIALYYYGGKMILSSTPDGKGDLKIDQVLQVSSSYPNQFLWKEEAPCGQERTIPPVDLTDKFFVFESHQPHNVEVSYRTNCFNIPLTTFDPVYLVNIDAQSAKPFLSLPWKYQQSHPNFQSAALSINSYFDHEYPLLSTGLLEPIDALDKIMKFDSPLKSRDPYSSHDGYDWGTDAGVENLTQVYAPQTGWAYYRSPAACGACGNQIYIDHGNFYQTRFYHLSAEGLVTNNPDEPVFVWEGDPIGKVGWTGNVIPKSEAGAHIHFMVVYDKNYDGNFDDNIPDGLVDPFGWQPNKEENEKDDDPWESYAFDYKGVQRKGMMSHYLWKTGLDNKKITLPETGGTREVTSGSYIVSIPNIIHPGEVQLDLTPIPVAKIIKGNKILSHGLTILAFTTFGNPISSFVNPVILMEDFSQIDLSNIDTSTISFYSSQDGVNWVKENTNVDLFNRKATTSVSHLTDFVLMGEMLDPDPPATAVLINGVPVTESSTFDPGISLSLSSDDGDGGAGVDYTIYDTGGGSTEYSEPLLYTEEGNYSIGYYSVDNVGNVEEAKLFEFKIQIAPPELAIMFDPELKDAVFVPRSSTESAVLTEAPGKKNDYVVNLSLPSGRSLNMDVSYREKRKRDTINIESLEYSNGEVYELDKNRYVVRFAENKKTGELTTLVQVFEVKGEERVRLEYNAKKNITKIKFKEKGEKRVIEEREGMTILQVYTENGTLNYSY